jgi:DNA-binding MurR/RpiR family transcriptional regulator
MFQERIRRHYDHLSPGYRKVADYLLSDYRAAAFMTAAGLAGAVGVDTTTVVRFAQRIEYPGFPELIDDVQAQVKSELSRSYLTEGDGLKARIQRLVMQDRDHLETALAYNAPDTLETIANLLQTASTIVVMGESYATPLAESFAGMLRDAGLATVYVGGDVYERAAALASLTYQVLVVGISPVSGPSGVARALRFAHEEGAMTLACTPSLACEAARTAEHLLYAPGEAAAAAPSLVGLYSVCTAIAQTLAQQHPDAASRRAAEVSRAVEELS